MRFKYSLTKILTRMINEQYALATANLKGRLFVPYQRDGVRWMLGMEGQTSGPKGISL